MDTLFRFLKILPTLVSKLTVPLLPRLGLLVRAFASELRFSGAIDFLRLVIIILFFLD